MSLKVFSAQVRSDEENDRNWVLSSSRLKMNMSIANNVAYIVLMDALDAAKCLPCYRNRVKFAFNAVLSEWKKYEHCLADSKFFDVELMSPENKARYNDVTCQQYYDFWCSLGYEAYYRVKLFISALANKYRLSLEGHGVAHAEELSRICCAHACLHIACSMWNVSCHEIAEIVGAYVGIVKREYRLFSVEEVQKKLDVAVGLVVPHYELNASEDRNIELGIDDVFNRLCDLCDTKAVTLKVIGEYSEMFKDAKKVKRTIAKG